MSSIRRASSSASGSSQTVDASRRLPHAGLAASSSGRAVPTSKQRTPHLVDEPLEKVEQRFVRPVEILDQHDHRPLGGELGEERHPGLVQPCARVERMEVGRDLEPEREPEDRRDRGGAR